LFVFQSFTFPFLFFLATRLLPPLLLLLLSSFSLQRTANFFSEKKEKGHYIATICMRCVGYSC